MVADIATKGSSVTIALIAFSMAATLAHVTEEWLGRGGPLHRYMGEIVDRKIPDVFAAWFFGVLLVLSHWVIAAVGYWTESVALLTLLIGLRLGDCLFSHWLLALRDFESPNPGLATTSLYCVESAILAMTCASITDEKLEWPIMVGAGVFLAVLPTLAVLGALFGWPRWRAEELL